VVFYDALATEAGGLYQVYRSGSPLAIVNGFKYTRSGGSLTVRPYASGSFTVGDVVCATWW
jgi:hypothetical protein